jgi:hypothetical protein
MTPAQKLAKEREDERRRLGIIEAFKMVFGTSEKTRTDFQKTVWREFGLMAYEDKPVFQTDGKGQLCPLRAAMTDGRRSLWADVKANVNFVHPSREDVKSNNNR